ncbi:MAG TPA: energy transducer TonB [Candidatus Sulfotelmatobacter sp.]
MNIRSILGCAIFLISLCAGAFSQDTQKRAAEMLERARHLTDIRSANAPAFRLKATFSFVGEALETVQGTYTEVWVSKTQWRKEVAAGDALHTEVGQSRKLWKFDKGAVLPEKARTVPEIMEMFPQNSAKLEFDSVSYHAEANPPSRCAITKGGQSKIRSAFCFDKNGVLLQRITPGFRAWNLFAYSCDYGGFRKFGDYWFPRQMACYEDRHKSIEVTVTDLVIESSPDPALFMPLAGGVELDLCPTGRTPPIPMSTPAAQYPLGADDGLVGPVVLSVIVDEKGKPQNITLLRPQRKKFDDSAVAAVRGWRFKPATCEGRPIAIQFSVEVGFTRFLPH